MTHEKPVDTDADQDKRNSTTPAGQEKVEDRPGIGQVTPEDYPIEDRDIAQDNVKPDRK
jgi:hypothetical protein